MWRHPLPASDPELIWHMRVLIIGAGYVGLPLARRLAGLGHEVSALRRNPSGETEEPGVRWMQADVTDPTSLEKLPSHWDWVVNCAASSHGGPDEYRRVYLEGTRNLLRWLQPAPAKYVYTSSTGVYAQNDGSIVTEASPAMGESPTSKILVETENTLLEAARAGFPAVILRVAGIYGPQRGYWLRQFLAGEARIEGEGERWLNMIHREDVGGAILSAFERARPGQIYNVCDDEPVRQRDLFDWLAKQLNRPMPPSITPDPAAVRKRGVTNKRISNERIKRELGFKLQYPTFREGFASELSAD